MTDTQPAGIDLARVALQAARAAAKNAPKTKQTRKRRIMARGSGRDPVAFGDAITSLVAEWAWEVPAAGGSVLDQWPTIAPELVGKVAAEAFDAERKVLSLRPGSPAYGAQLRLLGSQFVARINTAVGVDAVRSLRILPVGAIPEAIESVPASRPIPARIEAPAKTRNDACAAYHLAMAAVEAAREKGRRDPEQEVRDRYFGDVRSSLREPVEAFADGRALAADLDEQATAADDIHARALVAARAAKAGRPIPGVRRLAETA